jgi:hypothetical protein
VSPIDAESEIERLSEMPLPERAKLLDDLVEELQSQLEESAEAAPPSS